MWAQELIAKHVVLPVCIIGLLDTVSRGGAAAAYA